LIERLRQWLKDVPLQNPLERQHAAMIQIMLAGLISATLPGFFLALVYSDGGELGSIGIALISCSEALALVMLRRGRFQLSVMIATFGLLFGLALLEINLGLQQGELVLLTFALPITLAGLLSGRSALLAALGFSIAAIVAGVLMQYLGLLHADDPPLQLGSTLAVIGGFGLIIGVLGLFLDRFGASLRDTLTTALAREQELEQLRASLETTVAERTASLQATVDQLSTSQATIRELGAPILPVLPGVLVAPLIGTIDRDRSVALSNAILAAVSRLRAHHVIFDITGVPVVDTQIAQALLETAAAVRLLGAQPLLIGIRADVAQTIVSLDLDFGILTTYPNLQQAVQALLTHADQPQLQRRPGSHQDAPFTK
jgi:rsbT co-antagonist protein RsbR